MLAREFDMVRPQFRAVEFLEIRPPARAGDADVRATYAPASYWTQDRSPWGRDPSAVALV